jgi:HD-GYP domain-containing protein (c-di-GMP phosphodiesterase class II)
VEASLGIEQTLKYAEGLQQLYAEERAARHAAQEALVRVESSYRTTVRALAAALELRDDATGNHSQRVTDLGLLLAEAAAPELAEDPQLEYGFLLHDLGKIGVPDAVLLKPGPLNEEEVEIVRRHALLGELLLRPIPYLSGTAADVAAAHHERWDGGGYPRGLSGAAIPLAARIFSLADSYDAMTTNRPYRRALSQEEALVEIAAGAGGQFEPRLADLFTTLVREREVS